MDDFGGPFPFRKRYLPKNLPPNAHCVYLIYASRELLYVGETQSPYHRLLDHNLKFPEATRWVVEVYEDQLTATNREAGLIYFCQPTHNKTGRNFVPKFLR